MIESGGESADDGGHEPASGGGTLALPAPGWPERHGAAFAWTPVDNRLFMRDHKAYMARRRRHRAAGPRLLFWLVGASIGLLAVASVVVVVTLTRQSYAEPGPNLIAGAILGATASGIVLIFFGIVAGRWDYAVDPEHAFTTVRVGIEGDTLWFYRHRILIVFPSQGAFIDLARSDDLILGFVNRFTAYAFPRSKLSMSPEGREVLDWLMVRIPNQPGPEAPAKRLSQADIAWKRLPQGLRLTIAAGLVMLAIYAAETLTDLWRAAHPFVR